MVRNRFSPKIITGIMIALFFGVSLYLRIALPYDQVFGGEWIKFHGADAYYHMRLVDNMVRHFPQRITFDPFTNYPYGTNVFWPPFFDWLLAGIAWLVGLGAPTQHTVDIVSAYLPPILAAITVIPVYFIGKALFHRWVGVIAAGLVALLPGQFLLRSILGTTDHHVAEVLFTTVAMLFLILAVRTAMQKQLSFSHLKHWDRPVLTKPIIYSLLAGAFLGVYLLTWVGGLLFIFLIFVGLVVQFIIHHLRSESTDHLGIIGTLLFLATSVISLPVLLQSPRSSRYLVSLLVATLAPVVLAGLSRVMQRRKLAVAYYPLSLLGFGAAAIAVFYVVDPSLLESMVRLFGIFFRTGAALTILEVRPILFPGGNFSLSIVWANFTTSFFLSFISLGLLIYLIIKRGEGDKTLLVVWSMLMLAATFGQLRFAYYLVVNVALLTGYLSWQILKLAGFKETVIKPVEMPAKVKRTRQERRRRGKSHLIKSRLYMALAPIVIFFLVFFPNISPAINTAQKTPFFPDDVWYSALSWLKENTPNPFGEPDFYYEVYKAPPPEESYNYPETAYGVLAWWDYGHWITRIAHRIPLSNPFQQGVTPVAHFFIAQDEASATEVVERLGVRYIIVSKDVATVNFPVVVSWDGSNLETFIDTYYQRQGGKLLPLVLFHPEYYRSISVRLFNFDGEAVNPEHSMVISYEERTSQKGVLYKEVTASQSFPTYEEAAAYISRQTSGNHKIAGNDPSVSPVPLERLEHYKLVYDSSTSVGEPDVGRGSVIKIFEYSR